MSKGIESKINFSHKIFKIPKKFAFYQDELRISIKIGVFRIFFLNLRGILKIWNFQTFVMEIVFLVGILFKRKWTNIAGVTNIRL